MTRDEQCAHARAHPTDVRAQVDAACACDRDGLEPEAATFYDAAYALGDRHGEFLVGYGSTLKNVGRHADSERILLEAAADVTVAAAARAFLALTHHAAGRSDVAVAALIRLVAELDHADIVRYRRALTSYADELEAR
jgi:Tfp pilus assembly protein PilF